MAGNVREWCWNANGDNRLILGGAWGDPDYFFGYFHSRDPWDRSPGKGFRCARYDPTLVSAELMGPIQRKVRDYSTEQPVDDKQFEVFRRQYSYDPTALSADIHEERDEPHWKLEKVSYDSAYGERIPAYLYLPKAVEPPYQAVVFGPGSGGEYHTDSELTPLLRAHVELLTRTGRAVLRPVYKGLYERQVRDEDPVYLTLDPPVRTAGPRARRDLIILAIRDVMRSVDYLESRDEIRANAIAYLGLSLSARLGAIVLGLDQRFKAAVLWDGGLHLTPKELRLPEEDEMNFLPRVQTPTLMINARYDGVFPTEWSQRYFFEWLGVPANLKRHVLFDRGHGAGFFNDDEMREIVAWLDRHLGVP
jgi:dienelactone hydrolase